MNNNYNNFFYNTKRTVYKWWCVIYKPAYQLFHHGYWPNEKNPYMKYPEQPNRETSSSAGISDTKEELSHQMAQQIANEISHEHNNSHFDELKAAVSSKEETKPDAPQADNITNETNADTSQTDEGINTSNIDEDVYKRANEIMERLAREAAEDEAKKQAEIEKAKQQASEQERLAMIMKANEIDISQFIEEGKAHQNETTPGGQQ